MIKAAFVGFGEVNTPAEIIVKKCHDAAESLKKEGLDLIEVYPVTDDYEEKDIKKGNECEQAGEESPVLNADKYEERCAEQNGGNDTPAIEGMQQAHNAGFVF